MAAAVPSYPAQFDQEHLLASSASNKGDVANTTLQVVTPLTGPAARERTIIASPMSIGSISPAENSPPPLMSSPSATDSHHQSHPIGHAPTPSSSIPSHPTTNTTSHVAQLSSSVPSTTMLDELDEDFTPMVSADTPSASESSVSPTPEGSPRRHAVQSPSESDTDDGHSSNGDGMVSTKRKTGAHESPASTSPNSSNPNLQNTTSHNPARTASQKRASQRAAEAQTAPLKDRRSLTSSLASSLTSGTSSTSNFEDEDDVYRENGFKIGFAEDKNKKYRRTMEDAHAFYYGFQNTPGNGWFAIFDGHAGKAAAEWCGDHLHENFETILMDNPNIPVLEALNKAFLMTDLQLSERKASYSGCTAVVGYVRTEDRHGPKRVLYTANVGDARAVLCRNGKAIRLSYDHKGSDSFEAKRIVESGGFMMNNRVNGVLAVTRSLGDITMKEWIIGSPYSTETVLDENDTCLILACDGIWDVCLDQTAVDLVKKTADPQQASEDLLDHALENFSTDNLSVLTVKFDETFMRRRNAEL